ncbi:MAG: sprT domain-containing protein [Bacteroidota bacterium]|nr:sprT domain-containing protein [Bacteroidota bacterium]
MSTQPVSLKGRIPDPALAYVNDKLDEHKVRLLITRNRKSKSGDYRAPFKQYGHRISINGSLNPYAFLIVFLHEVAHLEVWKKYRNNVMPHGKEWQSTFNLLATPVMNEKVFPKDLLTELVPFFKKPPASSSGAHPLVRALRRYDQNHENSITLEEIPIGTEFRLSDGRVFIKELKQRTRYKCFCLKNKRYYLISAVVEVFAC